MPPKKSRNRQGKSSTKTDQTDQAKDDQVAASSVSSNDDYNLEIANYQKQIKNLQEQIEKYKDEINALKNENSILKQQNGNKLSYLVTNEDAQKNNVNVNASPGGIKSKGCTCKGNCSNKICGCVKKNKSCQESCRCNQALCKNNDLDKENVEQSELSKDGQKMMEKLGSLTLNQEVLHASQKKIRRSIFSPYSGGRGTQNRNETPPASPLTFVTRRRLFTQDSDELVDIQTDTENAKKSSTLKKLQDQTEKTDDNVDVYQNQCPQTNYEDRVENADETEPVADKHKVKQKGRNAKQTKRNIKLQKTNVINNENMDAEKLKLSSILSVNDNEGSDGEDEVFHSKVTKAVQPQRITRQKSKSASNLDPEVVKRKHKVDKAAMIITNEITISSSDDKFPITNNDQSKRHRVEHSPQPTRSNLDSIQDSRKNQNVESDNNRQDNTLKPASILVTQHSIQSSLNKTSPKPSTSTEDSTDNTTDESFNPMMPKRQLPRSPIIQTGGLQDESFNPMMPKRQLPRSPIIQTGGLQVQSQDVKKFSPAKKELAVAEVDWEQHQAELVLCKICKRKFWPHRIDVHSKSCKGI